MFQKAVPLEIPRNSTLTGVAGFLKVSFKFWKMSRKNSVMEFLYRKLKAFTLQSPALP